MKKVLLVAFAVLMLAGSVSATGYYRAYMGAYASAVSYEEDTNYVDNHSMCSLSPELYEPFEVWIWIVPSHRGVMAVEYRLNYPTGLIKGTVIQNPLIVITANARRIGPGVITRRFSRRTGPRATSGSARIHSPV
jgi:hypothetical protein